MNRISFYTFGCRLNQSETAVIERTFEVKGYKVVDFSEPADVVVVNTCTVTQGGDADTRRLVNKINRINPRARIALVGCQAQIQKEKLLEMPNVHWVIGNAKKMDLASILEKSLKENTPIVEVPAISRENFTISTAGIDRHHTRANLKIQDGCDFFCTFCEIPYARGRARSRIFEDILLEATALVAAGHKEVVLTGINMGTYQYENKTILNVVEALEKVDGLARIRISSIEPTTIPFELIERMGKTKLCRHLHIPLQSGSDEILKSMQRKYTTKEFSDFLWRAHTTVPGICLGTDIIVGFPGETEKHFAETVEFVRDLPLAYFHVFSYSDRTLNKSNKLGNKISAATIQKRSEILRELSARKRRLFTKGLLDSRQEVLFEEKRDGFWMGWTDNYLKASTVSNDNLKNKLITIELKAVHKETVRGEVLVLPCCN